MNKTIVILMLAGSLWACNTGAASDPETQEQVHEHEHTAELVLNNGEKWKADAATNENVADLQNMVQQFYAGQHTNLPDYQVLNRDLQKGLDKMIRECKMQGPDHDALHLWLEPLLKDVNELKDAGDIATAEKLFHAIDEKLRAYTGYFE